MTPVFGPQLDDPEATVDGGGADIGAPTDPGTLPAYPTDKLMAALDRYYAGLPPPVVAPHQTFLDRLAAGIGGVQAPNYGPSYHPPSAGDIFGTHALAAAARTWGGSHQYDLARNLQIAEQNRQQDLERRKAELGIATGGINKEYEAQVQQALRTTTAKGHQPMVKLTPEEQKEWRISDAEIPANVYQSFKHYPGRIDEMKMSEAKRLAKVIFPEIMAGRQSPIVNDLSRAFGGEANVYLRDEAALHHANYSKLIQDYEGANTFVKAINSRQWLQYHSALLTADGILTRIDELSDELHKLAPRTDVDKLNRGLMLAYRNRGGHLADVANNLNVAIEGFLSPDLAQIFRAGGSPTDEAMQTAKAALSSDWSWSKLKSATQEIRRIIGYRQRAINELTPSGIGGTNQYASPTAPPQTGGFFDQVDQEPK